MNEQQGLWEFLRQNSGKLMEQTLQHVGLTFISLLIAIAVGLPLGILISRKRKIAGSVLGIAGVMQTIPSIALLGFLIPILGIGPKPAIAALFLYALLPIIRNTYTGLAGVQPDLLEAAKGMGMTGRQSLFRVEFPLAMPVILAGIRTATVINVGVATLAAYIAAGGLGEFIFGGIALNNTTMILAGAIPAALLAVLFDQLLGLLQRIRIRKQALMYALPALLLLLSSFYLLPAALNSDRLTAGFTPEFMGRMDGYPGLKQRYGFDLPTVVISDAVMYKAAYEKQLDVISGYSTDGRIKAYDLVTLRDDGGIFPPYHAAPIVREDVLQRFPELEPALNLLAGVINDSVMTELNYRADYLHQSPERIAKDFLVSRNLFRPARRGTKGPVRIGSKIFAEQYILSSMYAMLIEGNTDLAVSAKTGMGGTKICFDALTNAQIDLYPEYTGTGLLAISKADRKTIDSLGGNESAVYDFVKADFRRQFNIRWLRPIGFNNSYALMMRREQATALKIGTITALCQLQNTISL